MGTLDSPSAQLILKETSRDFSEVSGFYVHTFSWSFLKLSCVFFVRRGEGNESKVH